ncbi:MAG: NERD domain-containing protein [Microthrixaceae bacterium]
MASLVPEDFDLESLVMSERRVATAMLERLGDEWLVVPSVGIRKRKGDGEIDLVVISPTRGATVIEVKGGLIEVVGGSWTRYGDPIDNPFDQVVPAKHALIQYLQRAGVPTSDFYIDHAVALPDVAAVPAKGLGPRADRAHVLCATDLEAPETAIRRFQWGSPPTPASSIEAFVKALHPDVSLSVERGRYFDEASRAIDEATRDRLSTVTSLDVNPRVLVEGGAGTGKSWLVNQWARRAVSRGERTAVLCFNRPMADVLGRQLRGTPAVVDTYHGLCVSLLESVGVDPPAEPDAKYWRKGLTKALSKKAAEIGMPFDTIIVDEAQDLRPRWLASLRALLDPEGPARLLMAIDPAQAIYVEKWEDPDEFARITLDVNVRNSRSIGRLGESLGGPRVMRSGPDGRPPEFIRASGNKELRKHVRRTIDRLCGTDGVLPNQIAVLTTHTRIRDALIDSTGGDPGLARWEDCGPTSVLCETIHRTKGLEWMAVIIATLDDPVDDTLLYVGATRPRMHLTLIGPASLGEAAGVRSRSGDPPTPAS